MTCGTLISVKILIIGRSNKTTKVVCWKHLFMLVSETTMNHCVCVCTSNTHRCVRVILSQVTYSRSKILFYCAVSTLLPSLCVDVVSVHAAQQAIRASHSHRDSASQPRRGLLRAHRERACHCNYNTHKYAHTQTRSQIQKHVLLTDTWATLQPQGLHICLDSYTLLWGPHGVFTLYQSINCY